MSTKSSVLIVDDEDICLTIATRMLEQIGVPVLCARDGVEALQIYEKNSKDISLIIMDIQMPRMNGVEAFRHLREMSDDVRVVIVSGYVNKARREQIDQLRPVGYIVKPLTFEGLAAYLDTC